MLEIDNHGVWLYEGEPLDRINLVQLYYTVLRKEGEQYFIVTPVEKVEVKVHTVPYHVRHVHFDKQLQGWVTSLNDETTCPIDDEHTLYFHGTTLMLRVKDDLLASFSVQSFTEFLGAIVDDDASFNSMEDQVKVHFNSFGKQYTLEIPQDLL
jgi:hypothetical protein